MLKTPASTGVFLFTGISGIIVEQDYSVEIKKQRNAMIPIFLKQQTSKGIFIVNQGIKSQLNNPSGLKQKKGFLGSPFNLTKSKLISSCLI